MDKYNVLKDYVIIAIDKKLYEKIKKSYKYPRQIQNSILRTINAIDEYLAA